jgi:hypothetical protein
MGLVLQVGTGEQGVKRLLDVLEAGGGDRTAGQQDYIPPRGDRRGQRM